jgi:hypothetical protein
VIPCARKSKIEINWRIEAEPTAQGWDDHSREDTVPFRHMDEACGHVYKINPSSMVVSFLLWLLMA